MLTCENCDEEKPDDEIEAYEHVTLCDNCKEEIRHAGRPPTEREKREKREEIRREKRERERNFQNMVL